MFENIQSILQDQCGLNQEHPIIVGVSGGPDSLCLMSILRKAGYRAIVGLAAPRAYASSRPLSKLTVSS